MWHWIHDRRRQKILQTPFPRSWEEILRSNVAHYGRLNESDRKHLRDLTQVFIHEKHWEGCGGLLLSDEIRVTIAAEASLLILNLPHDLYRNVESIFVYPSTVLRPKQKVGFFEVSQVPVPTSIPILGEARLRGPIVLVWDTVKANARHPESGHNVVFHEFAHKIDMLDGEANGTPPLDSNQEYQQWARICEREFAQLRQENLKGKRTFLDSYAATNEAEFFAVITEEFFDRPAALKKHHPKLYDILKDFYRQDPAVLELISKPSS